MVNFVFNPEKSETLNMQHLLYENRIKYKKYRPIIRGMIEGNNTYIKKIFFYIFQSFNLFIK